MIMSKELFFTKINAGEVVRIGRFNCRKEGRDYCFFAEEVEIFDSLSALWECVHSFILHGIDYSGSRGSKVDNLPALNYNPQQFNSMINYNPKIILTEEQK